MAETPTPTHANDFFPRGAVAFFVALLVSFAAIWFGVYALMMARSGH